jgi:site-specific DNA-methyltransferase (cytosine-N4-specific)
MSGAQGNGWELIQGHVLDALAGLAERSVHCVVTSPPYWSLRSYSTAPQVWGGSPDCDHGETVPAPGPVLTGGTGTASAKQVSNAGSQYGNGWVDTYHARTTGVATASEKQNTNNGAVGISRGVAGAACTRCGCWRGELGSEPTVEQYVANMVAVFRAVWRVLRDDGTLWLNLNVGSYASGTGGGLGASPVYRQGNGRGSQISRMKQALDGGGRTPVSAGYKPKDLIPTGWLVALALQQDGWYLRSAITLCKVAPMPESVTDRPTNATEMLFLLSKRPSYYYDQTAVRQPNVSEAQRVHNERYAKPYAVYDERAGATGQPGNVNNIGIHSRPGPGGANLRNWLPWHPEPLREQHYAAYPTFIPKLAIEAGTSAHGCCATCGAPWARVVERTLIARDSRRIPRGMPGRTGLGVDVMRAGDGVTQTAGWQPSCRCTDPCPPAPATVLDPFCGSGTTLLVANRLGRRGVGIELNPQYVEIAAKRLREDAPLLAALPVAAPDPQPTLFPEEAV